MSRTPIAERAEGRWSGLLPQLGISPSHLSGKHGPCPMCGGRDRFRYDDKDGKGSWICAQCGAGDGIKLLMLKNGWDFRETVRRVEQLVGSVVPVKAKPEQTDEEKRAAMNELWRSAKLVKPDDVVDLYLKARGVGWSAYPDCLRTSGRCRYQDDVVSFHPAMVAMVHGPDGKPATLHRTFLTADGRKAPVAAPRRLMPGNLPKGSAVRLSAPAPLLGVAEGIETAMAATKLFGVPCWAAINSTMMEGWQPPEGTQEVIVFGDNDVKFGGHASAYALAHRLAVRDLKVRVEIPDETGLDWNDAVRADLERAA